MTQTTTTSDHKTALFSALFAIFMAAQILFFQQGWDVDCAPVLLSLGAALALLLGPTALSRSKRVPKLLRSDATVTFLSLLGCCLLLYLPSMVGTVLLLACGVVAVVIMARKTRKNAPIPTLVWLAASLIIIVHQSGVAYLNTYATPLFFERLVFGSTHIDILYHSSLMGMFKTFGFPTIGMHGVALHQYHFGSHYLFAGVSQALDTGPLEFYNISFQIIFIPLFFKTLFLLASEMKQFLAGDRHISHLAWLFAAMSISMLKLDRLDVILRSESFGTGLILAFLFCAMLLRLFRRRTQDDSPKAWSTTDVALVGLLLLCGLATVLVKVSVGFALCVGIGWLYLREKNFRTITSTVLIAAFALAAISCLAFVSSPENMGRLEWFSYFKDDERDTFSRILKHIIAHHLWVILTPIVIMLAHKSWRFASLGVRYKRITEFAIVGTIVTMLPTAVYNISGDVYFSCTRWFAFAACLAILSTVPDLESVLPKWGKAILAVGVLYLLGMSGFTGVEKWMEHHEAMTTEAHRFQAELANNDETGDETGDGAQMERRRMILTGLQYLRDRPQELVRSTLVHIPKDERVFWDWHPERLAKGPKTVSLVVPALSEHAQLHGTPAVLGPRDVGYGLEENRPDVSPPRPVHDTQIMNTVQQLGFTGVLTLKAPPSPLSGQ